MKRKTSEIRRKATRDWIRARTAHSKAYIPREKLGVRKSLRNEKKGGGGTVLPTHDRACSDGALLES